MEEPAFFSIWFMGATMGLTACAATCLPFLGTFAFGSGGGGRVALGFTIFFLAGKVSAYTLLGALAGLFGDWLTMVLGGATGTLALAGAAVLAGLWLWRTPKTVANGCSTLQRGRNWPPFILGFALSLIPCAPLSALLTACALSGQAGSGASYGLAFGLGAAVTPSLIIIPLLALFQKQLVDGRVWLARWGRLGAGTVLISLGLRQAMNLL